MDLSASALRTARERRGPGQLAGRSWPRCRGSRGGFWRAARTAQPGQGTALGLEVPVLRPFPRAAGAAFPEGALLLAKGFLGLSKRLLYWGE